MFFLPLLPNGKPVPLTWPMLIFRYINVISWPLKDKANWWQRFLSATVYTITVAIYLLNYQSEIVYFRQNINNLDEFLMGIPTHFVLIEVSLRSFPAGLQREKFKNFLKKFYKEIYIEELQYPELFQNMKRQYWPVLSFCVLYVCALIPYAVGPIYFIVNGMRDLPYKATLPFDLAPLYVYVPVMFTCVWVGVVIVSTIVGENYTIAMCVFHLNGRYKLMQENLHKGVEKILQTERDDQLAVSKFNKLLEQTLQENVRLNAFAREVQNEFSFRLFVIISFIAATLCVLGFKVYTNPMNSISYIFWTIGKVLETIALGQVGSSIITTTDGLSTMYYESKWESLIERSPDCEANVRVMKFVNLSMLINRKPFGLTGLKFFNISLTSSLTILQGAGSYFTCLTSLR